MSSFCIRERIENIWQSILCRRILLIIFAALLVVGMILGIVLASNGVGYCPDQSEENNNTYVIIIVRGYFAPVFFRLLLYTILIILCCCLCSILPWLNYCKLALAFVFGIYLGTYIVTAVNMFGFVGIVFVILFLLPEQLINTLALFVSYCDTEENIGSTFSFTDMYNSNINAALLLAAAFLVKLLLVFTVLKIFTALI